MSRTPQRMPAGPPHFRWVVRRLLATVDAVLSRAARSPVSYQSGDASKSTSVRSDGEVDTSVQSSLPEVYHWWIDSVGSYLVFTKSHVRIGQAGTDTNDVAILGDLSGHHADLFVGSNGVVLVARAETSVNGLTGESFLLQDGDRIRMRSVEMIYRRPVTWSQTSRLEVSSRHRLPMSMDGIILLGETGSIGPRSSAIIRTSWPSTIHLSRVQGAYWVRGPEDMRVDGKAAGEHCKLKPDSMIEGPWGSFRWEPVRR